MPTEFQGRVPGAEGASVPPTGGPPGEGQLVHQQPWCPESKRDLAHLCGPELFD